MFAIQPKSLQEGQLIISSPELSIMEQTIEINEVEPTNIFPKAPFLVDVMPSSVGLSTNDVKGTVSLTHQSILVKVIYNIPFT